MAGTTVTVWDGAHELPAKVRRWDGTHELPTTVRVMPSGYRSVTAMLAKTPFYCAHRGGSDSFPEMSLYAYTQSVWAGYPALEISLQRTSDGVYVGVHDATLNRTSGTTGLPNVSAMTWADVKQRRILLGSTGGPQPYMRLEEYLEAYGRGSHVTFLDPKNVGTANYPELLGIMDAHGGPALWVAKYSGGASSWFTRAHERGYKTWGYFYEADYTSGAMAAQQGTCDILGMDWSASQAAWTAIKSYGRPVMGHICSTQAQADTALSKGAVGLMVSGALAVKPVLT